MIIWSINTCLYGLQTYLNVIPTDADANVASHELDPHKNYTLLGAIPGLMVW